MTNCEATLKFEEGKEKKMIEDRDGVFFRIIILVVILGFIFALTKVNVPQYNYIMSDKITCKSLYITGWGSTNTFEDCENNLTYFNPPIYTKTYVDSKPIINLRVTPFIKQKK